MDLLDPFIWLQLLFSLLFSYYTFLLICLYLWWWARSYTKKYWSTIFWEWDNGADGHKRTRTRIDTDDISFPKDFLWGVASSAHQVEGSSDNNQWSIWERSIDECGRARIIHGDRSGIACDHWNRVDEDTKLMTNIGVSSYRMSIEWSKVEPKNGIWNQNSIDHYHHEIDTLLAAGIEPMITLHHFTIPLWFDSLGGFEREENIKFFINFCTRMFCEYGHKVTLWSTFNEPWFYVFNGWMHGSHPPGKQDAALAGHVLKNILEAHVAAYTALKSLPNGDEAQIGICLPIYHFDAYYPLNPIDALTSHYLNSMFNEWTLTFFKTGLFHYAAVGVPQIKYHNPNAIKAMDWVGLNYLSHSLVRFQLSLPNPVQIVQRPGVIHTDTANNPIYPEGLYRAIKQLNALKVPIYVTENGCADATDDRRHLYLRRHIYALSRAIREGCDVRGYYYWSLMDTFEWVDGYDKKFGLYAVDFKTQERKLRDGAKYYMKVISKFSDPQRREKFRKFPSQSPTSLRSSSSHHSFHPKSNNPSGPSSRVTSTTSSRGVSRSSSQHQLAQMMQQQQQTSSLSASSSPRHLATSSSSSPRHLATSSSSSPRHISSSPRHLAQPFASFQPPQLHPKPQPQPQSHPYSDERKLNGHTYDEKENKKGQ